MTVLEARRRRNGQEGYDSTFGPPDTDVLVRVEPLSSTFHSGQDSRVDLRGEDDVVCVAIPSAELNAHVLSALAERNVSVAGPHVVSQAALVIAEASGPDIGVQVSELRRRARPDAGLIMVLSTASGEDVARAHAAGAFACLRSPLVKEELLGFVTAAQDSRAARVQAADLARKLDLESHLASIGRISAGLSHEVGSPLGAASLNMDMVERECARLVAALKWLAFAPPEDLQHRLAIARDHVASFESRDGLAGAIADTVSAHERLRTLFATMRGLVGRTHEVSREALDLHTVIADVRKWLSDELQGVELEIVGERLSATADPTLLGQLLYNLTSNAAHAAKSLSAPRIRIHVYRGGPRVIVSVRDNGPGIPLDMQERVFEPFFTTRRGKGGTGLGLALCREYALQMRADLSLWSVPGRGACFRISLPPVD